MKIELTNKTGKAIWLYYDVHGPEGGVGIEPGTCASVSILRRDTEDHPVSLWLGEDKVHILESARVELTPPPVASAITSDYDELGRLQNPVEWQQQVLLGLYGLKSDAMVAEFSPEIVAELNRVRLRFVDEFEAKYPGQGKGRAIWR